MPALDCVILIPVRRLLNRMVRRVFAGNAGSACVRVVVMCTQRKFAGSMGEQATHTKCGEGLQQRATPSNHQPAN